MSNRAERAQAIVDAIDGGLVVERPRFREATVLACQNCGHRFAIANERAAEKRTWNCKCGGVAKVVGYWAKLDPIKRKDVSNGRR